MLRCAICLVVLSLAAAYVITPPPTYSASYVVSMTDHTNVTYSQYSGMFYYDFANQRLLLNASGWYISSNLTVSRTFSALYLAASGSQGPYILYDYEIIGANNYTFCYPYDNVNPFDPDYYTYDTSLGNQTINGTVYQAFSNSTNGASALVYASNGVPYQVVEIYVDGDGNKSRLEETFTNVLLKVPSGAFTIPSGCSSTQSSANTKLALKAIASLNAEEAIARLVSRVYF